MNRYPDSVSVLVAVVSGVGITTVRKHSRGEDVGFAQKAHIELALRSLVDRKNEPLMAARDRVLAEWSAWKTATGVVAAVAVKGA